MMIGKLCFFIVCLALAALPLPGGAIAQDVTDADELVRQLNIKPEPEQEPKIRTRGVAVNVPNASQGRASFNTIQFEYDSDRLTPESAAQLHELGKALADERLAGESFIIEGHADAQGDDEYNKDLSQRRATTVRDYLTKNMGIAGDRLQAIGMGEEKPKTGE